MGAQGFRNNLHFLFQSTSLPYLFPLPPPPVFTLNEEIQRWSQEEYIEKQERSEAEV